KECHNFSIDKFGAESWGSRRQIGLNGDIGVQIIINNILIKSHGDDGSVWFDLLLKVGGTNLFPSDQIDKRLQYCFHSLEIVGCPFCNFVTKLWLLRDSPLDQMLPKFNFFNSQMFVFN